MIAEKWAIRQNNDATESPESVAKTLPLPVGPGQAGTGAECRNCGAVAARTDCDGDLICMTCGRACPDRPRPDTRSPSGIVYILRFDQSVLDEATAFSEWRDVRVQMTLRSPKAGQLNGDWHISCPLCGRQSRAPFGGQTKRLGSVPRIWRFKCEASEDAWWLRHATVVLSDRDGVPDRWFPRFY